MVLYEIKLPFAFHREESTRLFLVALSLLGILEAKEVSMSLFTILLIHTSIFPHGCFLGTRHCECSAHHT